MKSAIVILLLATAVLALTAAKFRDPVDGPGGFLWKPFSDVGGGLVVLMPAKFAPEKFKRCRVFQVLEDGKFRRERLQYTGRSNPDRPTYRATYSGDAYDGRIICQRKKGVPGRKLMRLRVENPSERTD